MPQTIPDPIAVARTEARWITVKYLDDSIARVLGECPFIEQESLLAGLAAFHQERMEKVPSADSYPEAGPWVEYVLAVDHELQSLTGMTELHLATYRSLYAFLTFRGYSRARPAVTEKCRTVFLPETEQGAFHIKNVDNPITRWQTDTGQPKYPYALTRLMWDGVGSGLHIDDKPEEIFPLPICQMCIVNCDEVPGAVQFLTRYSQFWGGANIVLYDAKRRSVAIEKCSHNFIEIFQPGRNGGSYCSGMACRDPQSPQALYQAKKRRQYLETFNLPEYNLDMTFWKASNHAEQMLGELMTGQPTVDEILNLFTTPWPKGMNKTGARLHPDQPCGEYTLVTHAELYDKKRVYRWQRDAFGNYPCVPEVYQF